jgi:hypothetical protein
MDSNIINFLSGDGRWCIAVLEAYLDEAGTHDGAPTLCVAAYVGNRRQWRIYEKTWASPIKDSGINCFHAENSSCDKLRIPLAAAIDKGKMWGVIYSVKPEIFKAHAPAELKREMGNAYAVCAIYCAMVIFRIACELKLGPVSFVYEAGQPNDELVVRSIKTLGMHKDPNMPVAGVTLGTKEEHHPLAAADFLAHVCGTRTYNAIDRDWYNYLTRDGKVLHEKLTIERIKETSMIVDEYIEIRRKVKESKRINKFIAKYNSEA